MTHSYVSDTIIKYVMYYFIIIYKFKMLPVANMSSLLIFVISALTAIPLTHYYFIDLPK